MNRSNDYSNYRTFAKLYGITKLDVLVSLYEVETLLQFLPLKPSPKEKTLLNSLLGVKDDYSYTDYERSNNTFELIRRFQEACCSPCRSRMSA